MALIYNILDSLIWMCVSMHSLHITVLLLFSVFFYVVSSVGVFSMFLFTIYYIFFFFCFGYTPIREVWVLYI